MKIILFTIRFFILSYFGPRHVACGILVPWPGIEPTPPCSGSVASSPDHQEAPVYSQDCEENISFALRALCGMACPFRWASHLLVLLHRSAWAEASSRCLCHTSLWRREWRWWSSKPDTCRRWTSPASQVAAIYFNPSLPVCPPCTAAPCLWSRRLPPPTFQDPWHLSPSTRPFLCLHALPDECRQGGIG